MKLIKQTVYLPVDGKDCDFIVRWYDDSYENDVKREEGYFFTPEQLNEYTTNVIKQALDTAAEKAQIISEPYGDWCTECSEPKHKYISLESITSTFEETFKRFEV